MRPVHGALLLGVTIVALGCETSGEDAAPSAVPATATAPATETFDALSVHFAEAIRDAIGGARQARFMRGGELVVVLDRFSPHLRLFHASGELLWTGGATGDGPGELRPSGMASTHDEVVVSERDRLTFWTLSGDSLIPQVHRLDGSVGPMGVEYGCHGEVILYGPVTTDARRITLSRVERGGGNALTTEPVWVDTGGVASFGTYSFVGAPFHRGGERLALIHLRSVGVPRTLIEFDCDFGVLGVHDEDDLIAGQLQGTQLMPPAGIASVGSGFVVGVLRPRRGDVPIRTELFLYRNSAPVRSSILTRSWRIMDYHPDVGLLLATDQPSPHFVIVPLDILGF